VVASTTSVPYTPRMIGLLRRLVLFAVLWPALLRGQSAQGAGTSPAVAIVDHAALDALLRAYVRDGLVNYDAFAAAPAFRDYLASLDRVQPALLEEQERLAFWLNVYNAFTIQLIVSHGERASIRNINRTLGVLQLKGPWSEPIVRAAGRWLTLDEVAYRIIRKEFADPRVYAAMTPAARGGPPLRSEAYTGAQLDAQLEDQMRRFLGNWRHNRFRAGVASLSPVILNHRQDFGGSRKELGAFLAEYFSGEDRRRLQSGEFVVRANRFDWALNAQSRR